MLPAPKVSAVIPFSGPSLTGDYFDIQLTGVDGISGRHLSRVIKFMI